MLVLKYKEHHFAHCVLYLQDLGCLSGFVLDRHITYSLNPDKGKYNLWIFVYLDWNDWKRPLTHFSTIDRGCSSLHVLRLIPIFHLYVDQNILLAFSVKFRKIFVLHRNLLFQTDSSVNAYIWNSVNNFLPRKGLLQLSCALQFLSHRRKSS